MGASFKVAGNRRLEKKHERMRGDKRESSSLLESSTSRCNLEAGSLEPDVLGSQSEFKMLAGITVIDPRTSGELCIERAPSR